jgi:predicted nucleic acid-binding protein
MAYIDTSVLVAYYCPEKHSRTAQRLISGDDSPAISALTDVEFCSALAIKVRTGECARDQAHRVLSLFRMHCADHDYEVLPVGSREYAAASNWITDFATSLKTVDALHLATAFANDLQLVTADKALAESAAHYGVKYKLVK